MAGCPIGRARKAAVREAGDGAKVIDLSKLDHPRAGLSHAKWQALSPGEKLERLFGLSLDRMADILSWPSGEFDPARLNAQATVARAVAMIGNRAGLLKKRRQESEWERKAREDLARMLVLMIPPRPRERRAPAKSGKIGPAGVGASKICAPCRKPRRFLGQSPASGGFV